jgi:hypothetical protein
VLDFDTDAYLTDKEIRQQNNKNRYQIRPEPYREQDQTITQPEENAVPLDITWRDSFVVDPEPFTLESLPPQLYEIEVSESGLPLTELVEMATIDRAHIVRGVFDWMA